MGLVTILKVGGSLIYNFGYVIYTSGTTDFSWFTSDYNFKSKEGFLYSCTLLVCCWIDSYSCLRNVKKILGNCLR